MPVLGGEATSASASSFMIDGKLYDTGNDEKTCEQACEILFDDVAVLKRKADKADAVKAATQSGESEAGASYAQRAAGAFQTAKNTTSAMGDMAGGDYARATTTASY
eukprot:g11304.t1